MPELWGEPGNIDPRSPSFLERLSVFFVTFLGVPAFIGFVYVIVSKAYGMLVNLEGIDIVQCYIGLLILGWFLLCVWFAFKGD